MLSRFSIPKAAPLALAAVLVTAACSAVVPDTARWSPTEAPKANRIDYVTLTHAVHFAPGSDWLAPAEAVSLTKFLASMQVGYGDQVAINVVPPGGPLSAERAKAIVGLVHTYDVTINPTKHLAARAGQSPDNVVVAIGRYVVTPPVCGDMSKPDAGDYTDTAESDFGCSNEANLGMMVANPADLVRGSTPGGADGDFAARGIEQYRKGALSKSLASELGTSLGGTGGGGGGGGQ